MKIEEFIKKVKVDEVNKKVLCNDDNVTDNRCKNCPIRYIPMMGKIIPSMWVLWMVIYMPLTLFLLIYPIPNINGDSKPETGSSPRPLLLMMAQYMWDRQIFAFMPSVMTEPQEILNGNKDN